MANELKEVRSRWLHPDDRELVRTVVDTLNEDHVKTQDAAIRIVNDSEFNFALSGLSVIKNRKRKPISYKARGRLVQSGKSQVISEADIKKALAS